MTNMVSPAPRSVLASIDTGTRRPRPGRGHPPLTSSRRGKVRQPRRRESPDSANTGRRVRPACQGPASVFDREERGEGATMNTIRAFRSTTPIEITPLSPASTPTVPPSPVVQDGVGEDPEDPEHVVRVVESLAGFEVERLADPGNELEHPALELLGSPAAAR